MPVMNIMKTTKQLIVKNRAGKPISGAVSIRRESRGFTILELMVASMVFAVIMLLVAGTIVRFTNTFQKGVVDSNTQNVARSITDTLADAIKNGDSVEKKSYGYCIGSTAYAFTPRVQYKGTDGTYALREIRGMGAGCPQASAAGFDLADHGQEIVGRDMRLSYLKITPETPTGGVNCDDMCAVSVVVAYGDDDLLEGASGDSPRCFTQIGSQFCAVRELSTTVKPWL